MPAINAVYVDGQAQLPQNRDDASVEWVYADGQAGRLPVEYWQEAPTALDIVVGTILNREAF